MKKRRVFLGLLVILAAALGFHELTQPRPGHVLDEARRAGRDAASFPAADEDYFHDMDGRAQLTPEEVKGRDMWLVWSGGDDRFWDALSPASFGQLDLLKTISSYPNGKFARGNRWHYLGLVNEPCFQPPTGPDPKRFGLWLDQRSADCPPDPFENEKKYPGVALGARGKTVPVGSYYGWATGIVGLRLFPNPDFDEAAAKKWDAQRYYYDPAYYNAKDLVKPYRVGMSCAFCHVGPNPVNPPADPENPAWANLSSNVGAQYFWVDRIFSLQADPKNFVYQLFHTSRPGSLDTSLVSTDNVNNPRTMNAVYEMNPRMELAKRWGKEKIAGGALDNKQLNDYFKDASLTRFFDAPATVWTPRVLKDGADSVGAMGALNRVYLNIGLFSEEWLLHFQALWGGEKVTPIQISVAEKNSAYWQATEMQTPYLAQFFLDAKATAPHHLRDAPGGAAYLTEDAPTLERGKIVFAERCARCHSSKGPIPPPEANPAECAGPGYLECWNKYWAWTKTDGFKEAMRKVVLADDFLAGNYLSTELRVPVTLLETNACSPLAANAIPGNIWDEFSSQSYKDLPSVGKIRYYHPVTGEPRTFQMPAGGRGYTRPPSLVSLWSTAPFLLNNTVGPFNPEPNVGARMASFQASIEQMLWPERRDKDERLGDKVPGMMDRLTDDASIVVEPGFLPGGVRALLGPLGGLFPDFVKGHRIDAGPLPKGFPIDALANLAMNPTEEHSTPYGKVGSLVSLLKGDLAATRNVTEPAQRLKAFDNLIDPALEISSCPDFVVNRGHYFGTDYLEPGSSDENKKERQSEPGLSDVDKRALIAFLKTF